MCVFVCVLRQDFFWGRQWSTEGESNILYDTQVSLMSEEEVNMMKIAEKVEDVFFRWLTVDLQVRPFCHFTLDLGGGQE